VNYYTASSRSSLLRH